MNWFKPFLCYCYTAIATVFVLTAAISSCKPAKLSDRKSYFDIKGFFRADSARLSKKNRLVTKTVIHNGKAETKQVHIVNWGVELSLFSQSDINKPAWQSSYHVEKADSLELYKAIDPALRTRQIIVKKLNGTVKWIMIYNHDKNMLYETVEELSYFPDSLYLVQRRQSVRLLGTNTYKIQGVFN